jgi:hypothetical protein
MRNVSGKSCRENQNTFCVQKLFSDNFAFYEIMWKNIAELGRPQMTIWRMCIACWISKATNIHSECVILIFHDNNGYVASIFYGYSGTEMSFKWVGCECFGGEKNILIIQCKNLLFPSTQYAVCLMIYLSNCNNKLVLEAPF